MKVYVSKAMAEVAAHYERWLESEIARLEAEQRSFKQAVHEQLESSNSYVARILDEMGQIKALLAEPLVKKQLSCQAVAASSEASGVVEGRGTGSAEPGDADHQSQ